MLDIVELEKTGYEDMVFIPQCKTKETVMAELFDKLRRNARIYPKTADEYPECRRGRRACLNAVMKKMSRVLDKLSNSGIIDEEIIRDTVRRELMKLWNYIVDKRKNSLWHRSYWVVIDRFEACIDNIFVEPFMEYLQGNIYEKSLWHVPGLLMNLHYGLITIHGVYSQDYRLRRLWPFSVRL